MELAKLLEILRRQKAEDDQASVEEARRLLESRAEKLVVPSDVRLESEAIDGIPGEWVLAPGFDRARVVLYLHGGGYVVGSSRSHRYLMQNIGRSARCAVLGIDYRLAPENPFPAAVEDAVEAYRWLLASGRDPSRVAIAGDSAGGGLALAALVALRDAGDPLPAAAACISPWTDLAASGESLRTRAAVEPMVSAERLATMARLYLGGEDAKNPLASPLYAEFGGLSPILFLVGGREILYDDTIRVAARASAHGVEVTVIDEPELFHVWPAYAPLLPEGQRAVEAIGEFLRQRM